MKKKIKDLCFIGCGNIGYEHALCASKLGANIKYVFSKNTNSKNILLFKKKFRNVQIITNLDNLTDLDVDAFIISIPWYENDNILKYFYKIKKPILIEKPVGAFLNNYSKIRFKKNKFIALNRRYYDNVDFIIDKLKKKNLITANILISSKKENFENRFFKYKNKIDYFSNIHFYDLINYFFEDLKVIKKSKNINFKKGNRIFLLKNKKSYLTLNIVEDSYENSQFNFRFEDGSVIKLEPLESLSYFYQLNLIKKNKQKKYLYKKKILNEKSKYKFGFYNQMKGFLEQSLTSNMIYNNKLCKFIDNLN